MVYCRYGVLAQLGARNIRIVEATGSNPVYSISEKIIKTRNPLKTEGLRVFRMLNIFSLYAVNYAVMQHGSDKGIQVR